MFAGHWRGLGRYGLPGLVAGLVLAWWGGGHGPTPRLMGSVPGAEASGTIAFTTTTPGSPSQLLYLIDTKSQAFAVYRVDSMGPKGSGSVKLEAARKYQYDLQLSEFNNQPPEVSAIEAMVKSKAK